MVDNEIKSLYKALLENGYTSANIGDENTFSTMMSDKGNRKKLYDFVTSNGDDIGDYDTYEKRLSGSTDLPSQNNRAKQYKNAYDEVGNQAQDSISVMNRADDTQGMVQPQPQAEQSADNAKAMRDYLEQSGELDRLEGMKAKAEEVTEKVERQSAPLGVSASFNFVNRLMQRFMNREYATAAATRDKIEETLDILDEASHADNGWFDRNVGSVVRGAWDSATRLNTWDFGVTDTADSYTINDIISKQENGEQLTSTEQNLLDAMGLTAAIDMAYQDQVSMGYNVGQSLPESAGFMAQMYLNPLSGLGKAAAKKFGTTMVNRIAARAAGDVVGTIGATAVGAGRVAADYYDRLNGQATFDIDDNGIVRYGGQTDQEEADAAIWKAIGSNFIENYTEAIGDYFSPIGKVIGGVARGGLKKMGLNGFAEALADIKSSQWSRAIQSFNEKAKFDGLLGELMEEEIGMIMNAATVGDQSFNPEDPNYIFNADTQIQTLLAVALMQGNMLAVQAAGSKGGKMYVTNRLNAAERNAANVWGDRWADLKEQLDNSTMESRARIVEATKNATDLSQEQIKAVDEYAARLTSYQAFNGRVLQNQEEMTDEAKESEAAYEAGVSMTQPEMRYAAERQRNEANAALEYALEELDGNAQAEANAAISTIRRMVEDGASANEMNNIINGVSNDNIARLLRNYVNMNERVKGITDGARNAAQQEVEAFRSSVQDKIAADGTITTATYRDEPVYVLSTSGNNAVIVGQDGKKQMVAMGSLYDVNETPASWLVTKYEAQVLRGALDKLNKDLNHHPKSEAPQMGIVLHNGEQAYMVVGLTEEGNVMVMPASYDVESSWYKVNNNTDPFTISEAEAWALQDEYYAQEEAKANGDNLSQVEPQNESGPVAESEQNVSEEVQPSEELADESASEAVASPSQPTIPTEGEEVLYHKVPVDVTLADLNDGTLDEVEQDEFIAAKKAEAAKMLDNLNKKKPKVGTNKAKYLAEKQAWEQKVAEALSRADYWDNVEKAMRDSRVKVGDETAEEIMQLDQAMNGAELAAQMLAQGRLPLLQSSYKEETGYGQGETQGMFGLFRSAENGGMNIDHAAELLALADEEEHNGHFFGGDSEVARNTLLQVLSEVQTRGGLNNYISNIREQQAKAEQAAEYEAYEQDIQAMYGVSVGEYEAMEEQIAQVYEGLPITEEQYTEFINTFVDEFNALDNGRESERNAYRSEGSSEVLRSEQLDNEGGIRGIEEQSEEVDGGSSDQSEVAQGESRQRLAEAEEQKDILALAERIANEEKRRKPLRKRARELERTLGVKVNLIERIEDVPNRAARAAIEQGQNVTGWYEQSTGEVCFYMPNLANESEVDATYIHEVVAHKGLRGMLGDKFDAFCDDVWDMMSDADKAKFINYPGVNGDTRAAADEYIAHLAENVDVTESAWSKFTELLKKFLKAIGIEPKMTDADIANAIKQSYQRLLSGKQGENVGDGTRFSVKNVGDINDNGVPEWYANIRLSGVLDQNNLPFISSPSGSIDFGNIDEKHHLPSAPIRLSMGNAENGYIHINRRHGKQIQNAGFDSIEGFVKYVVDNFTRIQEGDAYENELGGINNTYLVQLQDNHNNTLFIQLSRDGGYWNVNSAGIFNNKYGNKKKNIWSASEVQNDNSAVISDGLQSEPNADNGSTSNGTPSNSFRKDNTSESNKQEKSRFRVVSSEMDAEYLEAVNSGDMEKAQKMVNEAAKMAMPNTEIVDKEGYPMMVYHGTNANFNIFDDSFSSSNTGAKNASLGFFFTPHRTYAESIGGKDGSKTIMPVFLNITNPFEAGFAKKTNGKFHNGIERNPFDYRKAGSFKDGLSAIKDAVINKYGQYTKENAKKWKSEVEKYFDGLKIMTGDSSDFNSTLIPTMQYVAFNPSQIKSAEPVTYDDNGNVIPLSERFNPDSNDIRFRTTYHGSGAMFDRFDHSFMGTGEGAQAFGWGTYVTDVEDIAKGYANASAVNNLLNMDDNYATAKAMPREELASILVKKEVSSNGRNFDKAKEYVIGNLESSLDDDFDAETKQFINELIDATENVTEEDIENIEGIRHLYNVDIPDNDGTNYLEWDKPINNRKIRKIVNALPSGTDVEYWVPNHLKYMPNYEKVLYWMKESYPKTPKSGRALYDALSVILGSDKAASNFLSEQGFVGIEYPTNSLSGGNTDGTKNYVIFNEHDLDIVEHTRFRTVTDPLKIAELEAGKKVKVYRAMQLVDGKLYPPMSAKVNGKMRDAIELGRWEEAEERPEMADDKGYFKLDKGNGKSLKARYNPYIHTSTTPLNDQFSSAQDRPELVTVEVEIPESELTSGYKAEKAKDAVGKLEWKAGVVQGKLSGTRTVILSRWDKPIRIVPDSEVADEIVKMFGDKQITMPSNVVTPSLRAELEKRGVPFVETDNQGKEVGSTRFNVKDRNELVAVHNISEGNLRKVLNVGGLIMPSIAITKYDMGHEGYGDISLLFDKETINPSDRRNKVYGGDAWTPRFPQIVPKISDKVRSNIKKKVYELIEDRNLRENYSLSAELHPDNIERTITNRGIEGYYNEEWMKLAYLLDNGKKVKIPMKMKDYGDMSETIIAMAKDRGLKVSDIQQNSFDFYNNNKDFVEAIKNIVDERKLSSLPEDKRDIARKLFGEKEMRFAYFDTLISAARGMEYDLEHGGLQEILDRAALREAIEKKVKTNNADYNKWVDNLFDGIVEKYGIRNNRDWYTPSGDLRRWEQLYDAATPSNILKRMLSENEQGGSGGFWDSNIMGASAESYGSIEEIREKGKKRLKRLTEEEYDAWSNSIANRMSDICYEFLSPSQREEFGASVDAKIEITNAVAKDKSANGIYKYMKALYPKFTMEHANRVEAIVKEIQEFAIGYFEAKPQRIVPLSEVRKAIVPSGTSSDILDGLKDNGIDVVTYKKGNENARARLIKKESEGIRFRVSEPALDYAEEEDVVDVQSGDVVYTLNNIDNQLYKTSGKYMRRLYKNGEIGRVLKGEYAEIDQIKAKEEYNYAKPILEEYLSELEDMRSKSSNAAQRIIDGVISDIEYALDYYKNLSLGKDVWRTDAAPRFRVSDAPFYSNAERAVEGIKQEKATPQQWLAMIEKNGGLKAGEDKWLGLSDWLKGQDVKSLTKQEVLDYINANQIQIEEVHYGGGEWEAKLDAFNEEFRELIDEGEEATGSIYTSEWVDYAYEAMVDRYGDDFRDAFEVTGQGTAASLEATYDWNDNLSGAAQYYLGVENPINSTREDYTTGGLENKREIALVVPTIESWNENDEVHFGDAGDGRAVAWVRFGETTAYNKETIAAKEAVDNYLAKMREKYGTLVGEETDAMNQDEIAYLQRLTAREVDSKEYGERVLVIDEIQSKRHQEGREKGYVDNSIKKDIERINSELDSLDNENWELRSALMDKYKGDWVRLEEWTDKYGYVNQRLVPNKDVLTSEEYERLMSISLRKQELEEQLKNAEKAYKENRIPSAPFEKNWHELAMKRMLRYAAENGFDKVAWTKGAQQVKRYKLGDVIDELNAGKWQKDENGFSDKPNDDVKEVYASLSDGGELQYIVNREGVIVSDINDAHQGRTLTEVFGKDIAVKLMGEEKVSLKDAQLVIGGEGMKGFYDEILPRFMNKYGKKWGVKVGEVELPNVEESARKMWSVDVTDAMKDSVMEGQPMFRISNGGLTNDQVRALEFVTGKSREEVVRDYGKPKNEAIEAMDEMSNHISMGNKVVVINSEEDIAKKLNFIERPFVRLARRNKKVRGVFNRITNRRIIFGDRMPNKKYMKWTILHETTHEAIKAMLKDGSITEADMNNILEYCKDNFPNAYKKATDAHYSASVEPEESVCFMIGDLYNNYEDNLFGMTTFVENSEIDNLISNILDVIKYGKGKYARSDRQRERRTDVGKSRDGNAGRGTEGVDRERGVQATERGRASGDSEGVRFRVGIGAASQVPLATDTISAWDKLVKSTMFQLRETAVDYLTAVEKFQDLIAKKTKSLILGFEDCYQAMLHLSSTNKEAMDKFDSFFVKPLNKVISKLTNGEKVGDWKTGKARELVVYVEAKHGLERNRQMAVEQAAKKDKTTQKSVLEAWQRTKETILNNTSLTWRQQQEQLDAEAIKLGADLTQDHSGLSDEKLFGDDSIYRDGWQKAAYDAVEAYENANGKLTDELWMYIRNATEYSLRKQLESGLVDNEYVATQLERFQYYVPLRGFSEEIAEDVYAYMGETRRSGSPVKKAKGRVSEADNPFGAILQVAYSSISVGNKNLAKQKLLNLVQNHDTEGLVQVNKGWIVKFDTAVNEPLIQTPQLLPGEPKPEWVEALPIIPSDATPAQISKILADFEAKMAELKDADESQLISGKNKAQYRTLHDQRDEHQIVVMSGGKPYIITVTGNPRLAQSVNGLLNPDSGDEGTLLETARRVQRFMAGAFTSHNFAFSFANIVRDTMYANNQTFIRENPKYWAKFTANQKLGFGMWPKMMQYLYKYQHGTLDTSIKAQRLFKEFMENGGATGYTFVETQKEAAKKLAEELKKLGNGETKLTLKAIGNAILDCLEFMGQSAEIINRFAAYRTSRDMGRSISRSITDAKEITVNFNRKGAGLKTSDKSNSKLVNTAAAISQYGRESILFWNANMQAKYRLFENMKEHPLKTSTTLVGNTMLLGGIAIPILNDVILPTLYNIFGMGSDDDEEEYYDVLTDWERTHNICLRLPKGNWLKLPLSPEMVAFYTIGDVVNGNLSGKRPFEVSDYLKSVVDVTSPVSVNWSYDGWEMALNFIPTVAQPIAQNMMNVNFMGNNIAKEAMFGRPEAPEFRNVYRNTSSTLVALSKLSNKATGGDFVEKGVLNWNPGYVQNLISGYSGGYGTTMLSVADWMVDTANDEPQAVIASKLPLVSRFFISGNKDVKQRRLDSRYYDVTDFIEEIDRKMRDYKKGIEGEYADLYSIGQAQNAMNKLMDSEEYAKYEELKELSKEIKASEKALEENGEDELTRAQLNEMKLNALEILDK